MKRVAILQSNYLPWKGYFAIIAAVDEFIVFDAAQYTKNDWRNRNQIKSANGKIWLTVPVRQGGRSTAIDEVEVSDSRCFRKHWDSIRQAYARAPEFPHCARFMEAAFKEAAELPKLSEVNLHFLRASMNALGLETHLSNGRDYVLHDGRVERLVSLCKQAGATHYLTGPAARHYLDEDKFLDAGITVEWADYGCFREYVQPHPPFDHQVSIIDLLACEGPRAAGHLGNLATC